MKRLVLGVAAAVLVASCGGADTETIDEPEDRTVDPSCETDADCEEFGEILDAPVECGPINFCVVVVVECETIEDCAPWTYFELCDAGVCAPDYREDLANE